MPKVFIFSLNFGTNLESAFFGHDLLQKNRGTHFAKKDAFGLFQYIHSRRVRVTSLDPIEVHSFTRIFYEIAQVHSALTEGCLDIRRFYDLINELKYKENIRIICRVMVHGGIGSEGGFEMEDHVSNRIRRTISPDTICRLIITSFPQELRTIFTPLSPLHIQLISCSAASSQKYSQLERRSLASALVQSFMRENIFTRIQASTTDIMTTDYISPELEQKPIVLPIFDVIALSSSFFRERYIRRGVMDAFEHIEKHILVKEDEELMQCFKRKYLNKEIWPASTNMLEIIIKKTNGYQLVFCAQADLSVAVHDYATGGPFIDSHDLTLEAHRVLILQFFWLVFFYDKISKKDVNLLKYCIPASNFEILLFIREVEQASNRCEILATLVKCEKILKSRMNFAYSASLFGKRLSNFLALNASFFGDCNIQKYHKIDNLRRNFENPSWSFQSFDLP